MKLINKPKEIVVTHVKNILDFILKKIVHWNPNHCFKIEWDKIHRENLKLREEGLQYKKEANTQYNKLIPIYEMNYIKSKWDKYCQNEKAYKNIKETILQENRLEELKKDFNNALQNKEYIVKYGHHKSTSLDLSTCKRIIDEIENLYNDYGTKDYVKLYKQYEITK